MHPSALDVQALTSLDTLATVLYDSGTERSSSRDVLLLL
jgi:hypothetical protein